MKLLITLLFQISLFSCQPATVKAQEKTNPAKQSEELGKVSWYRNYDEALKLAKKEKKSVLILFQEVPGCSTCRNYGHNVLTHPMMVEGIEDLFIPLVIYNNKGGADKLILNKYNEPAWNNPVVRIVDANGENLVDRVAGNYSKKGLYRAMEEALVVQQKSIPEYFKLYGEEIQAGDMIQEKVYKMYCFWTGEKVLGAKEGVMSTQAGFANGSEVVKVTYNAERIQESELTEYAVKNKNVPLKSSEFRFSDKDHLFYLKKTDFRFLPLTELQKTKINSALGKGENATRFLSPKQKEWLKEGKGTQELYAKSIEEAWNSKVTR